MSAPRKQGKRLRTLSCWCCRAALGPKESRTCTACLEVLHRIQQIHGYGHDVCKIGRFNSAYRAERLARESERVTRELAQQGEE